MLGYCCFRYRRRGFSCSHTENCPEEDSLMDKERELEIALWLRIGAAVVVTIILVGWVIYEIVS